jgi:hypothetical protein
MTIKVLPSQRPFDEVDYKRRLMDEYKILQDKIDKIGSFGFTIKGWSVTAVLAASAAAGTIKTPDDVVGVNLGLLVMLCFFFRFEFRQVKLSRQFGRRARALERELWKIDNQKISAVSPPIPVPYMAQLRDGQSVSRVAVPTATTRRFWTRFSEWWQVLRKVDIVFYTVLVIFALILPTITHSEGVISRLRRWIGNTQHAVPVIPRPFQKNWSEPEC